MGYNKYKLRNFYVIMNNLKNRYSIKNENLTGIKT